MKWKIIAIAGFVVIVLSIFSSYVFAHTTIPYTSNSNQTTQSPTSRGYFGEYERGRFEGDDGFWSADGYPLSYNGSGTGFRFDDFPWRGHE